MFLWGVGQEKSGGVIDDMSNDDTMYKDASFTCTHILDINIRGAGAPKWIEIGLGGCWNSDRQLKPHTEAALRHVLTLEVGVKW
jgi:hypothetical protein